ncbi:MAG: hypothetical protein EHM12_08090 [Dehalococcoidia bacterium]|nr:MAG: hypothetical protein EHM12_08090 [Dehalococcoidia bacterium]
MEERNGLYDDLIAQTLKRVNVNLPQLNESLVKMGVQVEYLANHVKSQNGRIGKNEDAIKESKLFIDELTKMHYVCTAKSDVANLREITKGNVESLKDMMIDLKTVLVKHIEETKASISKLNDNTFTAQHDQRFESRSKSMQLGSFVITLISIAGIAGFVLTILNITKFF